MLIVVAVDLRVALEAYRYGVLDLIRTTRFDMVGLDLDAAKPMTDAATR